MIKLVERFTNILCRVRKIEMLAGQIENEMESISERDFELASLIHKLAPREIEILTLMTNGKKYSDLAKILGVSQKTIEAHRWNIRQKLKLNSSKDIARIVIPWMKEKQK